MQQQLLAISLSLCAPLRAPPSFRVSVFQRQPAESWKPVSLRFSKTFGCNDRCGDIVARLTSYVVGERATRRKSRKERKRRSRSRPEASEERSAAMFRARLLEYSAAVIYRCRDSKSRALSRKGGKEENCDQRVERRP